MKEDYTLQMSEKRAKIYGEMSLSHLFELLNFLDLQGFDEVEIDEYDGTMNLFKDRQQDRDKAQEADELKSHKIFEEAKFEEAKKEREILEKENQEQKEKIRALREIVWSRESDLKHEQKTMLAQQMMYNRQKEHIIKKVLENPDAQQIMDGINA